MYSQQNPNQTPSNSNKQYESFRRGIQKAETNEQYKSDQDPFQFNNNSIQRKTLKQQSNFVSVGASSLLSGQQLKQSDQPKQTQQPRLDVSTKIFEETKINSQKDSYIKQLEEQVLQLKRENRSLFRDNQDLKSQLLVRDLQGTPQIQFQVDNMGDLRSMMLALSLERENAFLPQEVFTPQPSEMTYEQMLQLQDSVGYVNRGLTKEQIKKIKKMTVFKGQFNEPCSICQSEFLPSEKYRKLQCRHPYHSKCIKQWLLNEKKCPICKAEVQV